MKILLEELRKTAGNKPDITASELVEMVVKLLRPSRVVLASSLSAEDQVLTHILCKVITKPRIFTLDTGRLFPETYETMEKTMQRYGFRYEILAPDTVELEKMVSEFGPNLFYGSVDFRKRCCEVRKINPLRRILKTADAWICGLRRFQAVTRTEVEVLNQDEAFGLIKVNPLFDWTEKQVLDYVKENDIPYNPLQDRGFRSIGCAPCTRAVGEEDDVRAGRWWWEEPEHKECGLHKRRK